jgi:hypothetical protein
MMPTRIFRGILGTLYVSLWTIANQKEGIFTKVSNQTPKNCGDGTTTPCKGFVEPNESFLWTLLRPAISSIVKSVLKDGIELPNES